MLNYKDECRRIFEEYPEEMKRLKRWYYSELEYDFLGFLDSYYKLSIPLDYTIIDFGCYQAVQAVYFKNHKKYIGVDNDIPNEFRFHQNNAEYFLCSIQSFIEEHGVSFDKEKTVAICSYVPDEDAWKCIMENFTKRYIVYYKETISNTII